MIILTSNLDKIREIKSYYPQLEIEQGRDIKEVLGNKDEVIIYKTLESGVGYVVEDTILEIDNKEIVDIKWKLNTLEEGMKIKWIVSLGFYFSKDIIKIYRSTVEGTITIPKTFPKDAFGFDLYFKPTGGLGKTLYELWKDGNKNEYSPRMRVLKSLLNDDFLFIKDINTIQPWKGDYQNE